MPSEERDAERCPVAAENTDGAYYCTRKRGHDGPCAAVPTERERIRQDLSETVTTAIHKTMERDAEMLGVWRVGRSVHRTIYLNDELVGLMDTPSLATQVVRALNERVALVEVVEAAQNRERALQAADRDAVAMWNSRLKYALDNLDAALGGWTE